jgi:TolA-binding protein
MPFRRSLHRTFLGTAAMLSYALVVVSAGPVAAQTPIANRAADQQFAASAGLHNRQAFDLAADEWQKFIKDFPDDKRISDARHYLGICRLQKQDYAGAVAILQELLKADPKFEQIAASQLYLGLAQFNLARGGKTDQYAAAEKTLAALLKQSPDGKHVAQALYYLGEAQYAQDKKAEAAKSYDKLVNGYADDPLFADGLYALGVALDETGKRAEAAAKYDEFLETFPKHDLAIDVGVRRAELFAADGKLPQAEKLFAAAAADKAYEAADYALLRQAGCVYDRREFAAAAKLYDALGERFPQSKYREAAQLAAGRSTYFADDYAGVAKRLSPLVGQKKGLDAAMRVEAAHWTARAALKLKQPKDALAAADAVRKAAADTKFAAQIELDRADALYETEGAAAAQAAYADLAKKFPQDPLAAQAQYLAAFTALEDGKLADARAAADLFLKSHAEHTLRSAVEYVGAEAQLRDGKYDDAVVRYDRLLKSAGEHDDRPLWTVRRAVALSLAAKHDDVIQALAKGFDKLKDAALRAEAHHLLGISRQAKGDYQGAAADFAAALKDAPQGKQADETTLALAESQRLAGDAKAAQATLAKFATTFADSPLGDTAQYRIAELAFAAGDVKTAETAYRRVIDDYPNSRLGPHARYGLAWSLFSRGEASEAAAVADALLKLKNVPDDVAAKTYYVRALARHRLKQYQPAADDLETYLKTKPSGTDRADALYVLGLCQEALEKNDAAATTFTTLLNENPKYAGAAKTLYELGWVYTALKKPDDATASFARLAKEHGDDPLAAEALFHVGEAAYAKQDWPAAVDAYYDAREKADTPDLAEKAAHKLGWTYFHQGKFNKAEEWFAFQQDKYAKGPLAQDAAFMEGESQFKQNKFKESLVSYERVKQPQGADFTVLALLHGGQAAAQLEDWKKARTLLDAAAKQFPDTPYLPEINYERAWTLQNLGQEDEALKLYEEVTAATDREIAARARYMIGELYFARKNHAEAVRHFFKAAYGYGYPEWQARSHFEAARCFEVLGKKEQAKQSYREVAEKFPQFEEAALAKKRLAELGS